MRNDSSPCNGRARLGAKRNQTDISCRSVSYYGSCSTSQPGMMRPHISVFADDSTYDKENSCDYSNRAAFSLSSGSPLRKRPTSPAPTQSLKRRKASAHSGSSQALQPSSSLLYCKETLPSESAWLDDDLETPRPLEMNTDLPGTITEAHSRGSPDSWSHLISPDTLANLFSGSDQMQGSAPPSRLSDGVSIPFDLDFDPLPSPSATTEEVGPFLLDLYTPAHDPIFSDQNDFLSHAVPVPSQLSSLPPALPDHLDADWGQFDLSSFPSNGSLGIPSARRPDEVPILPVGSTLTQVVPPPIPLPVGIARPPKSRVDESCEIIRISWMNNCKTGWQSIRPFPRAISKAKKFILDPIRINRGGMKLTVSVSDNLSLDMAGDESSVHVSLPSTEDEGSVELPLVESGQAIEFNCRYERPVCKNKRPMDWVRICDERNRVILEWSFEVFNPKWETMTKSSEKPLVEDTCTFAWLCDGEWKIVTGKLPAV